MSQFVYFVSKKKKKKKKGQKKPFHKKKNFNIFFQIITFT
jgi:hypothetical protein